MIKPGEIQQKARVAGVRDYQIEKDYELSWITSYVSPKAPSTKEIGLYPVIDFRYDKERDVYVCPQGQEMRANSTWNTLFEQLGQSAFRQREI